MSCFGGLFHITKTSITWWLYPQWLGDVQLGHLPTINPNINPSIIPYIIPSGWWYTYPSEQTEFVSWDYDIPNWMEIHKNHVPNHQPGYICVMCIANTHPSDGDLTI